MNHIWSFVNVLTSTRYITHACVYTYVDVCTYIYIYIYTYIVGVHKINSHKFNLRALEPTLSFSILGSLLFKLWQSSNSAEGLHAENNMNSLTHSLTHSLTDSLTHSATHLLTHPLNRSFIHSPTHSLVHSSLRIEDFNPMLKNTLTQWANNLYSQEGVHMPPMYPICVHMRWVDSG